MGSIYNDATPNQHSLKVKGKKIIWFQQMLNIHFRVKKKGSVRTYMLHSAQYERDFFQIVLSPSQSQPHGTVHIQYAQVPSQLFNYSEVCRFKWCNHGAVCVTVWATLKSFISGNVLLLTQIIRTESEAKHCRIKNCTGSRTFKKSVRRKERKQSLVQ